jgi:hypothetical protein
MVLENPDLAAGAVPSLAGQKPFGPISPSVAKMARAESSFQNRQIRENRNALSGRNSLP